MSFWDRLERKIGKYAIPNLSLYLILCYGCGYLLRLINTGFLEYLTLNPYLILHGQVWRIVSWILIPPDSLNIFTIIMLYFYYSIGTTLERTWGTFIYNMYILMGMVFTVIGSFLLIPLCHLIYPQELVIYGEETLFRLLSYSFSTYYINMSIFLGFAATFPNAEVLLMFILPIKVKWLGIVYGVLILLDFVQTNAINRIIILTSLLNFVVFFILTRRRMAMHLSPRQVKRRRDFHREVRKVQPKSVSKHKCAICGRNSDDQPDLEFRFCSKCNGNYEYCQDHLFTHTHVQ